MDHETVKLLYEVAHLDGKQCAGLTLCDDERDRLTALRAFFATDSDRRRRAYRRLALPLDAVLRTRGETHQAQVKDISGCGCLLASDAVLLPGQDVELRITLLGKVVFIFPTQVRRVMMDLDTPRAALEFVGIPLEMRAYRSLEVDLEAIPIPLRHS